MPTTEFYTAERVQSRFIEPMLADAVRELPDGVSGRMKMMEQCKDMMKMGQAKSAGQETPENALDIVKKRYARGEINRQEFGAMKKELQ